MAFPDSVVTIGIGYDAPILRRNLQVAPGVRDQGKYVVVYERVGAEWRIKYDIFNSDRPPEPTK